MSFLWSKKPPFEETTSSNDKTKVTFRERRLKRYLNLPTGIMGNPF